MTRARENFNSGFSMVNALIALESEYPDPPPDLKRETVRALRGASIVLLVSTFEEYLKHRTQDAVKYLNSHLHDAETYDFDLLPRRLIINHYHLAIKFASEGNKYDGLRPEDRIPNIIKATIEIPAKRLDPIAFSQTHSNPNSATMKQLFHNLGLNDTFRYITRIFEQISGSSVALTYVENNLDTLISLRNTVSHAISTMNISREDVVGYRDFVKFLVDTIDKSYEVHCSDILIAARRI